MTLSPVRIPADVDREDHVLAGLTARQLAIFAVTGLLLYIVWTITRGVVPVSVFLALAIPVASTAAILALGQRDGIGLDRLLLAAIRQRLGPSHQVAAPEGIRPAPDWLTHHTTASRRGGKNARAVRSGHEQVSPSALRLPAEAVTDTGIVDLGTDGLAVVAACSTVNFALRAPSEQEALTASFGRYLHSLTAPVQVLVRTERLDLSGQIADLRERAGGLPHPALEHAALEHTNYLTELSKHTDLLGRQVLLVLREPRGAAAPTDGLGGPGPATVVAALLRGRRQANADSPASAGARRAAESRLVRRLGEAVELLAPAGIVVTPLDAGQATSVLASACNPDTLLPPSAGLAGADEIITSPGEQQMSDYSDDWSSRDESVRGDGLDGPVGDIDGWDFDEEDPDYIEDERGRW